MMGLTVADEGGNNVLTHLCSVYVIRVYTCMCSVHMTVAFCGHVRNVHGWLG